MTSMVGVLIFWLAMISFLGVVDAFTLHFEQPSRSKTQRSAHVVFSTKATNEVKVQNLDNNNVITIPAESPLSLAAVRSGMRLSFQCKQGACSSCEVFLNGKRTRTCITKVPNAKSITIKKAPPL
jgi:ferredoxin